MLSAVSDLVQVAVRSCSAAVLAVFVPEWVAMSVVLMQYSLLVLARLQLVYLVVV